MASGWDAHSDQDSRFDFEGQDPALWRHLPRLVDGVTKAAISDATQLVALYQYHSIEPEVDNTLLKNLTGVSDPSVPCQLVFGVGQDQSRLPPKVGTDEHSYDLGLSFNKLLLAPTVYLKCTFLRVLEEGRPHTAVLEWHFNDYNGPDTGITDYVHDDPTAVISFTAGPATCSGLNKLERAKKQLCDQDAEIFCVLKSFLAQGRHAVKLKLKGHSLSLEARCELDKVRSRLPSGNGVLLPTIGAVEYAAFGDKSDRVHCARDGMLSPADTLSPITKHPMVPLGCTNTFITVKEAGVQLAYSAVASEAEAREATKLWAQVYHSARVFPLGTFAVLAVRFEKFDKLGSAKGELHYRLPKEMGASIVFKDRRSGMSVKVKTILIGNVAELPPHDAFFHIISESAEYFGTDDMVSVGRGPEYFDVKIEPVYNSATYASQLATVAQLQLPENRRWHGILLNQVHDAIEIIDLTQPKEAEATIAPHVRHQADVWLKNWMAWNGEQLAVIEGIKVAKGGTILVMGPAGTGKTLLQEALSIYFYLLGFHVLALAPANSNVDHLAVQLGRIEEREKLPSALKFIRMYPSVRDFVPKEDGDATELDPIPAKHSLVQFYDLLSAIDDRETDQQTARKYGLAQAVLHAAENHTHVLQRCLRSSTGNARGEAVNAWELLREFIAKWSHGGTDRESLRSGCDDQIMAQYRMAYAQCRAHLIGGNRFMLATTGNARASELVQHWYSTESEWNMKCLGVVVFVDEAAKDVEVNVWSGVVCEQWASGVRGVVMFGDDKQLKPTNTCSRGKINFNAFNDRLDIPLPCRLVDEGFPHYRLLEQRRMHQDLSRFPNREFYKGKLRDGAGTDLSLDARLPGLSKALKTVVAEHGSHSFDESRLYKAEATDADIRLHWVEVKGDRVRHPGTKSLCVREHVQVFFKMILPRLIECFRQMGKRVDEHVMVICAYTYAVSLRISVVEGRQLRADTLQLHEYLDGIRKMLRHNDQLTTADMPQVLTVDASQGREASMVVFDGSCQHSDCMGFVNDDARCNVAITRAKEVFWVIGGAMNSRRVENSHRKPATLAKYKHELTLMGKCHRFA
ncbi:hypothetical protein LTS09_005109 [Friedmanniomyces endolithicus]|nr:hypothetical protein LTS09_005109 [Friedmanniomyces endolithicus]